MMETNFCPVEADLDRMYASEDAAEKKRKEIIRWLRDTGRVEDEIFRMMREDGMFEQFVAVHWQGYAIVKLGLEAVYQTPGFDLDFLKTEAQQVCADYIAQEFDATLERLIDDQWLYWGDE